MKPYPAWICHTCGERHGNRECRMTTWHKGVCEVCGKQAEVTEPRDYGHLKDGWDVYTQGLWNGKDRRGGAGANLDRGPVCRLVGLEDRFRKEDEPHPRGEYGHKPVIDGAKIERRDYAR